MGVVTGDSKVNTEIAKGRDPHILDIFVSPAKPKAAKRCSLSQLVLQPGQAVTFNLGGERGRFCLAWRQPNVPFNVQLGFISPGHSSQSLRRLQLQ